MLGPRSKSVKFALKRARSYEIGEDESSLRADLYLTQCINSIFLESQLPNKIVNI